MGRLQKSYSTCMECGGKMKMKSGGKWIQSAIKNPGSFTKQAQSAGMSVPAFRDKVLANKEDYSSTTVKRANLAKTLSKMRKGQGGMDFKDPMGPDRMMAEEAMSNEMDNTMAPAMESEIALLDPNLEQAKATLSNLEKQAEMESVRKYQRMLNEKYGADLVPDGAWGPKTQAAYEKFVLNKSASRPKEAPQPAFWDRSSEQRFNTPANIMPTTSRPSLSTYLSAVPQKNKGFDKALADLRRMPVSGYGTDSQPETKTQTVAQARKNLSSSPLYKAATKAKTPSLSSFYINKTGSNASPIKIR